MDRIYLYLNALKQAALAGDAESQWLLAKYHQQNYSFASPREGVLAIWGNDHYEGERSNLANASKSRHALAQREWGRQLFFGNPFEKPRRGYGLKLWLSGFLGSLGHKTPPLNERLLALAPSEPGTKGKLLNRLGRLKLLHKFSEKEGAASGFRINYQDPNQCSIVLEQLAHPIGQSVTNAAESLATSALYSLLLAGVSLNPEAITWYEVYPTAEHGELARSLHKVSFDWDGRVYSKPRWNHVSIAAVPFDLTDILAVKKNG